MNNRGYKPKPLSELVKEVFDNYEKELKKARVVCECEYSVISEEPIPIEECERGND